MRVRTLGTQLGTQRTFFVATRIRDHQWLEMHGGKWRVTIAVPRSLQPRLGTRLKRSLNTDSLAVANRLKLPVVAELREDINRELELAGLSPIANTDLALFWREQRRQAQGNSYAEDDVAREVARTATDILGPAVALERVVVQGPTDDPRDAAEYEADFPIYDPRRKALADEFIKIQAGALTPFGVYHEKYLANSQVKARTKGDDKRAMRFLNAWCDKNNVPRGLESITRKIAVRFTDDFAELSGNLDPATQNKYLNRLSRFWQYLLKREVVDSNVWDRLRVEAKPKKYNEQERAFTDAEVIALLKGDAPAKLLDLMMFGALTGARLDAIVDLKVKDTMDGAFTFKPQKREPSARDIPIHRDLDDIVARRTAEKAPNDDLFPDWPAPKKQGSTRERSFKASNEFTTYRRKCGVEDRVEGHRRSLVNFHSFRRWFITKAERAGFSGDLIAAIVGHKRTGMTLGRYSEGPEMKMARRCVNAIRLPAKDGKRVPEDRALTPRRRVNF